LNRQIKTWLEQDVGEICVQGEMSNLTKPSSGHWYFTLKDSQAQIRCVFFRSRHLAIHQQMGNGHQVIAAGRLSLYEARGDYQLIIDVLTEAGLGDLHQQFEALKQKLLLMGLFDSARKKKLPKFPGTIGIITSPTGAAIRDMLTTLARRYPLANIRIYPSDVQGKLAAGQLVLAIQQANHEACCDVLILARGGGSLEDLWAFNEESLAHAIAASQLPIVTGIGHETDTTIADFVADLRAPTPTGAAEMICPSCDELMATLKHYEERLFSTLRRMLKHYQRLVDHKILNLATPKRMIANYWQRLDYAERQLQQALSRWLMIKQHRLQTAVTTLNTISPLATLQRGYAIVTLKDTVVTQASEVTLGDELIIQLAQGTLLCSVISGR
jgi:exodeoxyribonuclease VII large subunit